MSEPMRTSQELELEIDYYTVSILGVQKNTRKLISKIENYGYELTH